MLETTEFRNVLDQNFPGSTLEEDFVSTVQFGLKDAGFTAENSITCVGVCRDELCDDLVAKVGASLGPVFRIGGLGGFIVCGHTGFGAAHAHSPIVEGRKRYVYIVAPHIAIDNVGNIGKVARDGIENASSACGALCAFHGNLKNGKVSLKMNLVDVEMSMLKKAMAPQLVDRKSTLLKKASYKVPDLAELTKLAEKVIVEDQLFSCIDATVDTSQADYAVVAGIQIHGPGGKTWFHPVPEHCITCVKGVKSSLNLKGAPGS
ncbi:unnamed protein product [Choristocarpus tenellus]